MPVLCDINFLTPLCYEHHEHHVLASDWLGQYEIPRSLAVCRIGQLGLLRLLCTRAVMHEETMAAVEAWQVYDNLMLDDRFTFVAEPVGLDPILRQVTSRRGPATHLWTDAYLAAFAITAGLQFVTFDQAFRQFEGLDLILLGNIH